MTHDDTAGAIRGSTAAEIAASVRGLIERGELPPAAALPPVRALAERLGVNRNTAVAAYRQLAASGLVESRGRGGTRVAAPDPVAREGFARDTGLRDVGTGNPDPRLIPDPSTALASVVGRPVLYGAPVADPELEAWAHAWLAADLPPGDEDVRVSVTGGAADALERLLTAMLAQGDAVAIEEPGFLTGIHMVRVGGYRAVPIEVDAEGITPSGLRAALDEGVRAIVCTPRAQNPTGGSLSEARAAELRGILTAHPYVLVIEDDHFSMLSRRPYLSLIPRGHRRWALVRSVSKFLGPDMGLALVGSDAETAARLGMRLRPGTAWVSHLLQRLSLALLTDEGVRAQIDRAGAHYAERNRALCARLADHGIACEPGDGLSVWVPAGAPAHETAAALMRRGWLARSGDEFRVAADAEPSRHLRVTAHHLDDAATAELAAAIAASAAEARR
ncbi:aminotransferase class I/II-fold pyridoxal phosphate-dependent enzyme [Microbacterium karelineae]|uniref:aminotransferase class I/II-fold pyridoxal phosphate-dependent enzyme n=1 Tax=Microbacterium karelineae TaxID=2654283 RepID=UPI0012E9BDB4|nr:aminotransferase class I/II-fold pyridoxal phosphate-dependent enzyme [Microbacterium karelineae]